VVGDLEIVGRGLRQRQGVEALVEDVDDRVAAQADEMVVEVDGVEALGVPIKLSSSPGRVRGRAPRAGVASLSSARLRDGSLARTSERGREFALRLGVLTPRKQRFDRDRALEILLARP